MKFLFEYKEFILLALYCLFMVIVAIASLIILICKKLKSTDNDLLAVISELPDLIRQAEILVNVGKTKFTYVFTSAIEKLAALKDIPFEDAAKKYGNIIDFSIENILSTPTKKEVSYAKNNEKKS